jgi:hypothetical protein
MEVVHTLYSIVISLHLYQASLGITQLAVSLISLRVNTVVRIRNNKHIGHSIAASKSEHEMTFPFLSRWKSLPNQNNFNLPNASALLKSPNASNAG